MNSETQTEKNDKSITTQTENNNKSIATQTNNNEQNTRVNSETQTLPLLKTNVNTPQPPKITTKITKGEEKICL